MLTPHELETLAAVRAKIRVTPGISNHHAHELERSFDLVVRALQETPDTLTTWSHMTVVIDTEVFADRYDVSAITKEEMDTLTDAMNDYWVGGKEWDRALEYAARGVLERKDEQESEAPATNLAETKLCECCARGEFTPSQEGNCWRCEHEHQDHLPEGVRDENQTPESN